MRLPPGNSDPDLQAAGGVRLREDAKIPSPRIALFQYASVAVFLFLIGGFWILQIQNPGYYNEQAERNRVRSIPIPAPRGKIFDRDGRVIVDNHASFSLILSRETLKPAHLRPIADGLQLDYDDLAARLRRFHARPRYEPIVVKEELTPADLAFVEAHRDYFPEMEVIHSQRRLYPQDGMLAHVIGYTGEISEPELGSPDNAKYNPGDVIGKFGIERQYNGLLMGTDGQRQALVDNRGREREVLGIKEAVPGRNLELTLDLDLQSVAELALEGRNGAVVALDPRTGEVLAMVSRPAFDPNKFAVRIKPADWRQIAQNPDHPLMNKAIQAQQAPGSTFKPMLALASLEAGSADDQFSVHCGGGAMFYGRYFKCHLKGGHGNISLHRAIAQSCDVYFYNVGNKTGIDQMAWYASQFGLGQKTGIDLPHEAEGTVPSPQWKLRNFRQKWYAGETISVSIGQGALTVTPLQLVRAIGGLTQNGVWYTPHLLRRDTGKLPVHRLRLDPHHVEEVISGMCAVVNEGGTGVRARIPGIEVCGKTGTAQLASNAFLKGNRQHSLKDNAWFVGFAPRRAPEIVVAALFENGEEGYLAAPIVRDVLKSYFDKKLRLMTELERERSRTAVRVSALGNLGLPGGKANP